MPRVDVEDNKRMNLRVLPEQNLHGSRQGDQERLHPGTPTFGSTQFHGREFPPQTWKHQPNYSGAEAETPKDEKK